MSLPSLDHTHIWIAKCFLLTNLLSLISGSKLMCLAQSVAGAVFELPEEKKSNQNVTMLALLEPFLLTGSASSSRVVGSLLYSSLVNQSNALLVKQFLPHCPIN
jgi:hypothetical protein